MRSSKRMGSIVVDCLTDPIRTSTVRAALSTPDGLNVFVQRGRTIRADSLRDVLEDRTSVGCVWRYSYCALWMLTLRRE